MRNTFKVLFYTSKSKEKNGIVPIMGRITVNGQVAQFSCKLSVPLSLWGAKGNRAHCNGHLHRNPFAQYHISPNVKERQFLTEEELQRVMTLPLASSPLARVRDIFVFCSLTGISFTDTKNLTTDNLENINGGWWIVSKRQKTGVTFQVKLLERAYRIIERYEPARKGNRLFRLYGNTYANRMLKQIAKECGIEKPVSWHCSRHTFGTLAVSKGMPIESVSKILGHTNITTTQIYAKITIEKLDRDISAFGEKVEAGLSKARAKALSTNSTIIQMPTASPRSRNEVVN